MFGRNKINNKSLRKFNELISESSAQLDEAVGEFTRKRTLQFSKLLDEEKKKAEAKGERFNPENYDITQVKNPEISKELKKEFDKFKEQVMQHINWLENNSELSKLMKQ